MTWEGNGAFVWEVKKSVGAFKANSQEGWDYLANLSENCAFSMLPVKVADGQYIFNQTPFLLGYKDDILDGLFATIEGLMIPKVGWQYVYGYAPEAEANRAAAMINRLGLTHFIIDAESEFKTEGAGKAEIYMDTLVSQCPDVSYALCSYRFPRLHPEFPWSFFLKYLDPDKDVHMPQCYWQNSYGDDAGSVQLKESYNQLMAKKELPLVPVGPAYGAQDGNRYWSPTLKQMDGFVDQAHKLGCPGVLWWELGNMLRPDFIERGYLGRMRKYSESFAPPIVPPVVPDAEKLQRLWNAHPELH